MRRAKTFCRSLAYPSSSQPQCRISAAAEVRQLRRFQQVELLGQRGLAEIPGMIVRDAHAVEVAREQRDRARVRAEGERFDFRRSCRRDDAFEVRDAKALGTEVFRDTRERITTTLDDLARRLGDHDVTDEG
jgi:hypothetical protein